MAKSDTKDLKKILKPFPKAVNDIAFWLRDFVWGQYPDSNELIYDNYNAVAFGWSLSDKLGDLFCNVAVWRPNQKVVFGFYWGSKIPDPEKKLQGNGNQFRYLAVPDTKSFPKSYAKTLIMDAYAYSLLKTKTTPGAVTGKTILKSVSANKRVPAKKKAAGKVKRVTLKKAVKKTAKQKK